MRRIIALALALMLVMSLGTTAFAAETTVEAAGDVTITTKGIVGSESAAADVIAADIVWDEMTFTYNGNNTKTWDPVNMWETSAGESGAWVKDTKNITITNRSNVKISATAAYAGYNNNTYLTMGSAIELAAASAGDASTGAKGTPTEGTISVSLSDNAPAISAETSLGNITLQIAKVTESADSSNA